MLVFDDLRLVRATLRLRCDVDMNSSPSSHLLRAVCLHLIVHAITEPPECYCLPVGLKARSFLSASLGAASPSTISKMSYMRGDLLTRTRKLVKGLAKPAPKWLKAMEMAPPLTFPRSDGKIKQIVMPEDIYVKKFFKNHPDSLYHDAVKISGFDPPPARVFAWRVLELKKQGVIEEEAMAVADMEYLAEKKAKRKAYKEVKKISCELGKEPPPNPYPSAIKEIQAEEKAFVHDRFFNPKTLEIVQKMKDKKAAEMQEQFADAAGGDGNGNGGPRSQGGQHPNGGWPLRNSPWGRPDRGPPGGFQNGGWPSPRW